MHLCFFVVGYFSYTSPVDLHSSNFFESYFTSGWVWIGILLSILIFILWFNQYFKQNAFKLHYPKSNFSLYKEFCVIFLISLLSITQYFSYTKGLQQRVASLTTTEELEKEIDLTNRVAAFTLQIPHYRGDIYSTYEHINRCVDVPVFDSLVSRDDVLKLYVQNQIKAGVWQNVNAEDYQKYKDSISNPLYTYNEYTAVLSQRFPQRTDLTDSMVYKTNEVYDDSDFAIEVIENQKFYQPPSVSSSSNLSSIYNYCGVTISTSDTLKNGEYYAKETYKLLNQNQRSTIQNLLNEYLKTANKYEVGYRFKDRNWIDYVYNPPYYFVDYELTSPSRYSEAHQKTFKKDYIAHADMENSLKTIREAKTSVFESYSYLIVLYIALVISLLIYTFRITTMRVWVISVVGSIVVFFIYFCLYFLFGMLFSAINESYALILFLGFIALFFILAFTGIFSHKRKLISGVNFIWSLWTFGAVLPILIGLYVNYLEWKYPYDYQNYYEHAHLVWLRGNGEIILYLNLILVFLFMFLILPVVKKWKSMAEE